MRFLKRRLFKCDIYTTYDNKYGEDPALQLSFNAANDELSSWSRDILKRGPKLAATNQTNSQIHL